jgi:hypothetical protein
LWLYVIRLIFSEKVTEEGHFCLVVASFPTATQFTNDKGPNVVIRKYLIKLVKTKILRPVRPKAFVIVG